MTCPEGTSWIGSELDDVGKEGGKLGEEVGREGREWKEEQLRSLCLSIFRSPGHRMCYSLVRQRWWFCCSFRAAFVWGQDASSEMGSRRRGSCVDAARFSLRLRILLWAKEMIYLCNRIVELCLCIFSLVLIG